MCYHLIALYHYTVATATWWLICVCGDDASDDYTYCGGSGHDSRDGGHGTGFRSAVLWFFM